MTIREALSDKFVLGMFAVVSMMFMPHLAAAQATDTNASTNLTNTAAVGAPVAPTIPAIPRGTATSESDLRVAIQASILSDPRSSAIPPAQMNALVDQLVLQAQDQHMTAADILWRPRAAPPEPVAAGAIKGGCGTGWEAYLCEVNRTFGFGGNDPTIAIILLVTSGLLIFITIEVIAHHKKKLAAIAASTPKAPPWENMPQ